MICKHNAEADDMNIKKVLKSYISLFYGIVLMCLQKWFDCWLPKKLLMDLYILLAINILLHCWNFINVDLNGRELVIKSSLETKEIHMVSHSHSLGERPRLQKSVFTKIQLYQAWSIWLEMESVSNIFYKTSVFADSSQNQFLKQIG